MEQDFKNGFRVLDVQPVTLVGRVVCLEPLTEAHIPGLVVAGQDPSLWEFMVYGNLSSEAQMRNWVCHLLELQVKGTDLPFAVIHREKACVAGATRFMEIRSEHRTLEIGGTWYAPEFQRTIVNTESKFLLLEHAFERLGCVRVQFKTDSRNLRSQKAIERIGAVKEGVIRQQMFTADGYLRDSVYYSILDKEWPAVRRRLKELMYPSL